MEQSFDQFNAALLYCNKCRRAMPVRERLLLVLRTASCMIIPARVAIAPSVPKRNGSGSSDQWLNRDWEVDRNGSH